MIVNAGGEQLHMVESGPSGAPPLLLSAGLGGAWFDWDRTAELLRTEFRVIAFDRPGLGLSPAAQAPPSLRRDVRILAGLARLAGRTGSPVTVLAHSMAAFHAEALARVHPELVGGLVLADPSYERDPRSTPRVSAALAPFCSGMGAALGATRLAHLAGPAARRLVLRYTSERADAVPPHIVRRVYGRGTVLGTVSAENLSYREQAADLAALRTRRPFPQIPVTVLTALGARGTRHARDWSERHRLLAAMTPYGHQIEIPGARHMLPLDHPAALAEAVAKIHI